MWKIMKKIAVTRDKDMKFVDININMKGGMALFE